MNDIWRFLHVKDILNYCATNRDMKQICDDPETWRYLLYRDFNLISLSDDPQFEYMDYSQKLQLIDEIDIKVTAYTTDPSNIYFEYTIREGDYEVSGNIIDILGEFLNHDEDAIHEFKEAYRYFWEDLAAKLTHDEFYEYTETPQFLNHIATFIEEFIKLKRRTMILDGDIMTDIATKRFNKKHPSQ